jgi:glycerol kinase
MATALVAGVDSSTTATKVEVRDLDSGKVVGRGSSPHPPTRPPRSEQDPAAWWAAFEAAWGQAASPEVAAISVAGQQHGMVALDADRRVIRPAKLWNDTESAPDAARLIERLPGGRAAWADACGLVPVASFTITKLSWLRRHEPEAWPRLAHVVLPHDWLTYRLTGRLATDRGDASGTGYFDATAKAAEYTDQAVGQIIVAAREAGRWVLLVGDHGNAEIMAKPGPDGALRPYGGHTTSPVPVVVVPAPNNPIGDHLGDGGSLADIAPTVLALLGRPIGTEMTGRSLL